MIQIKNIRKSLLYIVGALCVALIGCDKTPHEEDILTNDSQGAITVTLNTNEVSCKPFNNIHIYLFDDSDMLAVHKYYPNMTDLALDRILVDNGNYTVFAILNTEEDLTPTIRAEIPNIALPDFKLWVKTLVGKYPDLLTSITHCEIKNRVVQLTLNLKGGAGAIDVTTVTLNLTYPEPLLPDYIVSKASRAGENVQLRAIAELLNKGTNSVVLRHSKFVERSEDIYKTTIDMPQGEFDIRIWGDYAEDEVTDYHYNTANLKDVNILPKESYWANTDTRDGFGYATTINVGKEEKSESYILHRPLAKYKIVATDVEAYELLRVKRGYPPLEELKIYVMYAGFFPAGYSVADKVLTDSREGYKYTAGISESDAQKATVAKDFVLVNGAESSVVVNIIFKDADGNTISGVNGVRINYKAGYLTTISGDFLTAGKGGVDIDTSWDDEFNIEF